MTDPLGGATWAVLEGDCQERLRELPDGCVDCCVTSPPYWGLRDYGADGQLGLEPTPEEYVAKMVAVFEEVWRVCKPTATVWLNLGDTFSQGSSNPSPKHVSDNVGRDRKLPPGLKPKDLVGIPWRVAFALQAAGWWLRSDIIWAKPNPMPESVTDRPTRSHEFVFLLTKAERYWYDADAVREAPAASTLARVSLAEQRAEAEAEIKAPVADAYKRSSEARVSVDRYADGRDHLVCKPPAAGRNKRSVWTIATQPYPEAHFATYPEALVQPCVRAGCPPDGIVLDPFAGSGTTGLVAVQEGRRFLGLELNPEYAAMARRRIGNAQPPLFADVQAAQKESGAPCLDFA